MAHPVSRYSESNATFSVHASGVGQNIFTTGVYETKEWSTELWDVGNQFNLVANEYQPTTEGYYHFNGSISLSESNTATIALLKNGAVFKESENITGITFGIAVPLMYMNGTTDVISLAINRVTGSGTGFNEAPELTWFDGAFIHEV